MILDRFKTLRKSQTSIQREGQARQGRLKCVCPKFRTDAKPKSTHRHSPYEYSYNSSQPHISRRHHTCLINALLLSLVYIDNRITLNSDSGKHYPTKRTIISLLPNMITDRYNRSSLIKKLFQQTEITAV